MNSCYLLDCFGLQGRTALVTGAGRGLGWAIAHALGSAGARVVVNDLDDGICTDAVEKLSEQQIDARSAAFSVTDRPTVQAIARRLSRSGWTPDILVNCAGTQNRKPFVDMAFDEWQALLDVHVNGAFNCTQAFLPEMITRGFGRIVIISSVAGLASMPNIAAYTTAKGALAALARSLAVEYAPYGITANAVAPGFVRTQFTEALQRQPDFENRLPQLVPCGRWATPDDIAPAVLFLASPAGSFINGQTLAVDGGMLARM